MAEGKRPGGLTALAVLNFVFGGLFVLVILALVALIGGADEATQNKVANELEKMPNRSLLYVSLTISILAVGLMITSGIGYLGQKRFLGRTLGNTYGILALGNAAFSLLVIGEPFGIATIIGLVYPVLTLILLNSTFKDDLVN